MAFTHLDPESDEYKKLAAPPYRTAIFIDSEEEYEEESDEEEEEDEEE